MADTRSQLEPHLDKSLPAETDERKMVAGIIGDRPSLYAKSPALWNAAFDELGLDAIYVAFDVPEDRLESLCAALRTSPSYIGGSITVPYKVAVMEHLDEVDPLARSIGAVNTIARDGDGRLVGYNTDAVGGVSSLVRQLPWQERSFLEDLAGLRTVLIGAGGAARAAAFAVAEKLGDRGSMTIVNRSADQAKELAAGVDGAYGNATAACESDLEGLLEGVDLVINASTRGQSGTRRLPGGLATCLEPYSSLAPAEPAALNPEAFPSEAEFYRAWFEASVDDIEANRRLSDRRMLTLEPGCALFDLIYSPLETPLLAQGRLSGHPTLNGKGMNLLQAVEAFMRIMGPSLDVVGRGGEGLYDAVMRSMLRVW